MMRSQIILLLSFVMPVLLKGAEEHKSNNEFVIGNTISLQNHGIAHTICYSPERAVGMLYAGYGFSAHNVHGWDLEHLDSTQDASKTLVHPRVKAISYSSRNQLATGSGNKTVKMWDNCIALTYTTPKEDDWIHALDYSPDGTKLAYGCNAVKVMDCDTHQIIQLYSTRDQVNSVRYSPDGNIIASGVSSGAVRLSDLRSSGTHFRELRNSENVYTLDWAPDRFTIIFGGNSRVLTAWDTRSTHQTNLPGHTDTGIYAVRYSPNGKMIASGSWDKTIKLWNATTYACLETIDAHDGPVKSIAWLSSDDKLASGSDDGTIKIWTRQKLDTSNDGEEA